MAQQYVAGKTATSIKREPSGRLTIRYHDTDVVTVDETTIHLETGGWFTMTTKTRMNQASWQFDLGYHVFQNKGTWYVEHKNQTFQFRGSGITLKR